MIPFLMKHSPLFQPTLSRISIGLGLCTIMHNGPASLLSISNRSRLSSLLTVGLGCKKICTKFHSCTFKPARQGNSNPRSLAWRAKAIPHDHRAPILLSFPAVPYFLSQFLNFLSCVDNGQDFRFVFSGAERKRKQDKA